VDVILIEIADGILQQETGALLGQSAVTGRIDGMVFAAGDAMGAAGGVTALLDMGLSVITASGVLTASPLATREAQTALRVPVYNPEDLGDPTIARNLAERAGLHRNVVETLATGPFDTGSETAERIGHQPSVNAA
jgi:hypothetical protein